MDEQSSRYMDLISVKLFKVWKRVMTIYGGSKRFGKLYKKNYLSISKSIQQSVNPTIQTSNPIKYLPITFHLRYLNYLIYLLIKETLQNCLIGYLNILNGTTKYSIHLSIYPSIHLSIHLSIYLSIHLLI